MGQSAPSASEQPVDRKKRDQPVLARGAEPGGDQQGSDLVAVQPDRVRLVVQRRSVHVHGRRVLQQVLLNRVAIEPGDRAELARDRGPGAALGFQVTAETFDVGAPRIEQMQAVHLAPGGELT
jgi:hypothetical protein